MEIAIAVNSIKKDQMFFDIKNQSLKHDIVVYTNKECYLNKNFGFSILTYYDIWNSNAKYHIATCLNSASHLLLSPKIKDFYFYIWDLEWHRKLFDYEEIKKIYCNKKIKLVAKSNDHAKIIYDAWNIMPTISKNFDINQIVETNNEKINI